MQPTPIALDGPAGSGKSTFGAVLARRLDFSLLDIGVVYRLVALTTLRHGGDVHDPHTVEQAAIEVLSDLELQRQNGETKLVLAGETVDVASLHAREVNAAVPLVARHEVARERVRALQRAVASRGPAILVGRDIGTVVLPDADLKLYLDVSLEVRAARRRWSLNADDPRTEADIAAELAERDRLDAERHHSPMRIPPDAVVFTSEGLSVEESVDIVLEMCGLGATNSAA